MIAHKDAVDDPPRLFEGQTVFLCGAGPSLKHENLALIEGRQQAAINLALRLLPRANVLYFSDMRFWRWYQSEVQAHPGLKIAGCNKRHLSAPGLLNVRLSNISGLSAERGVLRHGNNSGYAAINLIVQMGPPKRIVLLGFDMRFDKAGDSHFHDDHPCATRDRVYEKMIPYFGTLVQPLRELGIEIVNANPHSAIECFPKMMLREAARL